MKKKYTKEDIKVIKADPSLWDDVDISKKGFEKNLNEAVCNARDFARKYVTNILPDEMLFLVCLGCSNDIKPLNNDECTYPEDYENLEIYFETQSQIVELLWRDGRVPEWIDVTVHDADKNYTHIKLICCGRFSSNKMLMYHPYEGKAPFHVVGPDLPLEYVLDGDHSKFDLHWRKNA